MARRTVLPGMDRFNRVLCCRETFLTEIIRAALSIGRFNSAVTAGLTADVDRAAKEAKKARLLDALWRKAALPRFPSFEETFEPADFDATPLRGIARHGTALPRGGIALRPSQPTVKPGPLTPSHLEQETSGSDMRQRFRTRLGIHACRRYSRQ